MAVTRRRDEKKSERHSDPIEPVSAPQAEVLEEPAAPKVTAILVVYNQAVALRRAVEALERSQDRERLEILVVDCGSDDESPQLDAEFPEITMMRLPHNFGATKAMNIGLRTAKGEMAFYLSPNVEVAPDTVSRLAERLESETDTAAVCPLLVDSEDRPVSKIQKIPTRETLGSFCSGGEPQTVPIDLTQESMTVQYPGIDALMTRKQYIKGMNYFDERFGHFGADADMAMQTWRAQKKIRLYPGIRAIYHANPDPLAGDPLIAADRVLGASAFLGKYNGFMAGLGFRVSAAFRALFRLDLRQFSAIVSGQKLDGSQAM
jgi:N-acetylglucosaminyl-diphospho-decaprenol L-rhamnosyltransferase